MRPGPLGQCRRDPPHAGLRPRRPRRSPARFAEARVHRPVPQPATTARRRVPRPTTPRPPYEPQGGVPDERLIGDVAGAAAYLRGADLEQRQGRGDRLLLGRPAIGARRDRRRPAGRCRLLRRVRGRSRPRRVLLKRMVPIVDRLGDLRCPLLGLFGVEDKHPSPEHVAELDRILSEHGKDARVPLLRRRRARVLRGRPTVLPRRGRQRRLGHACWASSPAPGRAEPCARTSPPRSRSPAAPRARRAGSPSPSDASTTTTRCTRRPSTPSTSTS